LFACGRPARRYGSVQQTADHFPVRTATATSPKQGACTQRHLIFVFLMVGLLAGICYKKGEPPRWRWGDQDQ